MPGTTGRSGGARPGAGRKKGTRTPQKARATKRAKKATPATFEQNRARVEDAIAAAIDAGETPLEYFLDVMRHATKTITVERNGKTDTEEIPDLARRDWAASQAAPYIHARLQVKTIETMVDHSLTIRWEKYAGETKDKPA